MAKSGKNLTYLRATNQGAILKTILLSGPKTRLELAAALNLTAMSISYITSDLLEKGILTELSADTKNNTPGRHSAQLALVPRKITAIGVSISRNTVNCTLADLSGKVMYNNKIALTDLTTQDFLTKLIIKNVQLILDQFPDAHILGIGISAVGIVDSRKGTVCETTDFFGICDWPIGNILKDHFQIPTYIVEDMKSSALAESYYGIAKNYSDFVYLGVTRGIGVGVIYNGKLFEGHSGFSGEIGHITLYNSGLPCPCGNTGCMEMYLSVPVILEKAGLSSWEEFLVYCEREPNSPVLQQFLDDIGVALVTLSNLFDPQAIIIGHEGATLNSYCFDRMQRTLNERTMTRRICKTVVHPSSLSQRISYLNASSIVFSHLFLGDFKL